MGNRDGRFDQSCKDDVRAYECESVQDPLSFNVTMSNVFSTGSSCDLQLESVRNESGDQNSCLEWNGDANTRLLCDLEAMTERLAIGAHGDQQVQQLGLLCTLLHNLRHAMPDQLDDQLNMSDEGCTPIERVAAGMEAAKTMSLTANQPFKLPLEQPVFCSEEVTADHTCMVEVWADGSKSVQYRDNKAASLAASIYSQLVQSLEKDLPEGAQVLRIRFDNIKPKGTPIPDWSELAKIKFGV